MHRESKEENVCAEQIGLILCSFSDEEEERHKDN